MPGEGIRAKIKRRWSMKAKDAPDDFSDADDETSSHLRKEIERAEAEGHDQGRPGGLLHRLISYGNDKTEKQMREESERIERAKAEAERREGNNADALAASEREKLR